MSGKIPDRVPLMCQMSIGHMLLQTGYSPSAFWNSSGLFAEGLLAMRKIYGFDGILISLHGHSPRWEERISRVQKTDKAEIVIWKTGGRTVFPSDDLPLHFPAEPRKFRPLSEVEPDSLPEDIDFIPVSQELEFHFDPEHPFDIFDLIVTRLGSGFSVHGEVTSPFDYFLNLLGPREALIGLVDDPSKARAILQRYTDAVKKIAVAIAGRGVDAIKVSSPYAGSGFISPRFYREFILPFECQIARAVRRRGVAVYIHTCGAINDRLEMMVEAGFSGIECLDPPPLGNVELAEAKKRIGRKAFIKGNIDPVHVLLRGTKEEVRQDAERRLEMGKPGGGYILSTSCSIAPYTKKENIQALSEVIEDRGYY